MSLRFKTILGVALIEGLLLMVLIYTALGFMRSTNHEALQVRAETTATLFATTTKDAVLSFDLASLEAFSSELIANQGIRYVRVLDADEQLLASAGDQQLLELPFFADLDPAAVDDGVFDVIAYIQEGGERYGHVELGISTEQMEQVLKDAQNWSITIASIEMALVALFSFILGTYLTFQLAHLRRAAKSVGLQNLNVSVPIKGRDEVAEVGRAFNAMIDGLRIARKKRDQYEAELKELNEELEKRVAHRTEALLVKNEQLAEANEQIKSAQVQLMRSEKLASLGQMAAGVAHEVNNPIGFVSSNLQSLDLYIKRYQTLMEKYQQLAESHADKTKWQQRYQDVQDYLKEGDFEFIEEDVKGLVEDSLEGAERVRLIVRGLKEFSHVGETEWQYMDVNSCIESTVKLIQNQLRENCKILTDLKPLPNTRCNPGQMNQVIMNLVMNASQAVEQGAGLIHVRSSLKDDTIEIRVSDNGSGISEENLAKLFDPFFTTKDVGEGTGLGLAISYGIVEDHQGTIDVKSKQGVGSVFCIRLPVVDQ